jgi:hypothetical protein
MAENAARSTVGAGVADREVGLLVGCHDRPPSVARQTAVVPIKTTIATLPSLRTMLILSAGQGFECPPATPVSATFESGKFWVTPPNAELTEGFVPGAPPCAAN